MATPALPEQELVGRPPYRALLVAVAIVPFYNHCSGNQNGPAQRESLWAIQLVPLSGMLRKTSDKFMIRKTHDALNIAMSVVFEGKCYLVIIQILNPVIADCNLMGISSQVSYHRLRTPKGWFCINYPFLVEQGVEKLGIQDSWP